MTTAWIPIGVVGLVALVCVVRIKTRKNDLGEVSDQWIAHQRADKTTDLR